MEERSGDQTKSKRKKHRKEKVIEEVESAQNDGFGEKLDGKKDKKKKRKEKKGEFGSDAADLTYRVSEIDMEEKSSDRIESKRKKHKKEKAKKVDECAENGQLEEKLDGSKEKKKKRKEKKGEFGSDGVDLTSRVSEMDMVEKNEGDTRGRIQIKSNRKKEKTEKVIEEVESAENGKFEGNSEKEEEEKKKKKKEKKEKMGELGSDGVDSTSRVSESDVVEKKDNKRKRVIEGGDLRKKEKRSKKMSKGDNAGDIGLEESNKEGNGDDKLEMREGEKCEVEKEKKRKRKRNEEQEKTENMRKGEELKNPKERSKTNKRIKKASKSEEKSKNNKKTGKETATENGEEKKNENGKVRKKVHFADEVEVFSELNRKKGIRKTKKQKRDDREGLIWGQRFTQEEDDILLQAIDDYIKVKQLGEKGREMILDSKKHKLKGCWKDIAASLPHRPYEAIYYRARNLIQVKTPWTPEDRESLLQYQAAHGNKWKNFAYMHMKSRRGVKDAWRILKHANRKKGSWCQEEYQALFNLVNTDLKLKVFTKEPETHLVLRDNISWEAISETLGTRTQCACCDKWYRQLTSPLVHDNLWMDTDDYRLIIALQNADVTCIEEVDWDNLLPHREGEICQKRWQQMVRYIGEHKERPFVEQLEVLSQRYCPEMLEYRAKKDELL